MLYVFLYISLIIGFLSGAFLIWISGIQLKIRYLWLKKIKKADGTKNKNVMNDKTNEASRALLD